MFGWARSLIRGTPLERPARAVWSVLRPARGEPGYLQKGRTYDRQTEEIIARVLLPGSSAVDVGAHSGVILESIVNHAPGGSHWAFEPLPEFAAQLRIRFENVRVVEVALSDHSGETTFQHVINHPGYSGLIERPYDHDDAKIEEIRVQVGALDDFIDESEDIHFIKVDVEGGELGVLRGAQHTILRNRPYIVFEHGKRAAAAYGSTTEEIFDLLQHCGLSVSRLGDWLEGRSSLTRQEFSDGTEFMFLAHP